MPTEERRLVRDPYSKLGGVASGLAHYYGLDVSLVRILFVLFALTTGFGFLLYLVAWLVIPRATHWPPAGPARSLRSLTGRDLAIVLVLGGLMFAVAAGAGGATGTVLVPLLLVGGGIWLLVQEPTESPAAPVQPGGPAGQTGAASSDLAGAADTANLGVDDDTVAPDPGHAAGFSGGGSGYSGDGGDDFYGSPGPIRQPVPPRSRRRRVGLIGIILAGVLVVIAVPVLLIGALIAGIASGNIDFEFDQAKVELIPTSIDAIPDSIVRDNAEIVIDLTTLDVADFDDLDAPIPVDAKTDVGSIRVIVPDEVAVDVQADVDVGSVSVFGESDDGFNSSVDVSPESAEAAVDLDLDVGIGEIVVERP